MVWSVVWDDVNVGRCGVWDVLIVQDIRSRY